MANSSPLWLQFLLTPATQFAQPRVKFWLGLSLLFGLICAGLALKYSWGEYVVDADARQHVFWMQRFADPELFPQDWITNYHASVAPSGYTAIYWLAHAIGISPLLFNKFLPLILGTITTIYGFWLSLELLPLPFAGFLSTLLLNQTLWMRYDLVSGTARSFVYPLFLAFLYYLTRRQVGFCLGAIALQGLFYPQILFVAVGVLILSLVQWRGGKIRLVRDRGTVQLCLLGLLVAVLVMLPYALQSSEFAPAVTAAVAKTMPEFLPGGRTRFFHSNFWEYWLYGKRSGIMPQLELAPLALAGLTLPMLLRWPNRFPLVQQVSDRVRLLASVVVASLGMFFIAHGLLFKLHLPSRYTMHSLLVVLTIAAGLAIVIWLEGFGRWLVQKPRSGWTLSFVAVLSAALVCYPLFTGFPYTKYKAGTEVALYEFLQQQPKSTRVASLAAEADNIPTFARRSVLVSDMYAIPYHVGYYREIRQRTQDLIQAQYSLDRASLQAFVQKYSIDYWLLDATAFSPNALAQNNWLMQYPPTQVAIAQLQQGQIPAIAAAIERCTVLKTQNLTLLAAKCL